MIILLENTDDRAGEDFFPAMCTKDLALALKNELVPQRPTFWRLLNMKVYQMSTFV